MLAKVTLEQLAQDTCRPVSSNAYVRSTGTSYDFGLYKAVSGSGCMNSVPRGRTVGLNHCRDNLDAVTYGCCGCMSMAFMALPSLCT